MPVTIRGPIQINAVTSPGLVKFGDCLALTPKTVSKAYAGSGTFNTAIGAIANTVVNGANYINPNVIDEPIAGNN